MPRYESYMNCKADAWLTPDQRLASAERVKELRLQRKDRRRLRRNAVVRAKRVPHPRVKPTHCLNGHERVQENVTPNGTCKLCDKQRKSVANAKQHPVITRACAKCGAEFQTTRKLYCSVQCKHSAKRRKKNIRKTALRWYANLTHEEEFLIRTLWSRELRKANEKRKAQTPMGRAKNIAGRHRRRAKEKGNGGSWTGKQWRALKAEHGRCLGCGRAEAEVIAMGRKLVPDHIKPVSIGGANSIENLQPLCHGDGSSCNMLKSARWIDYRQGFPLEII
jgi:hypothetical protein